MREYLPAITAIIVIISLFAAIFFGMYKASIKLDDELWNIYVCENCGKRIEIYEVR